MNQDEFQSKAIQIAKEKGNVRDTIGVSIATLFTMDTGFNEALHFKDDTLYISYNEEKNLLFVMMKYPFRKNILYSKNEETIYFDEDFDYIANQLDVLLGISEEDKLTCPICMTNSTGREWDLKTTEHFRGRTYNYDSVLLKSADTKNRFNCPYCNEKSEKGQLIQS